MCRQVANVVQRALDRDTDSKYTTSSKSACVRETILTNLPLRSETRTEDLHSGDEVGIAANGPSVVSSPAGLRSFEPLEHLGTRLIIV